MPGGKLVGVNVSVRPSDGRAVRCRLDGDFFVEGDDAASRALIEDIEHALIAGEPVERTVARHADARLIGASAAAIETAFARATGVECAVGGDGNVAGHVAPESQRGLDVANQSAAPAARVDVRVAAQADDCGKAHINSRAGEAERWRARWAGLNPVVIHDRPRTPADQMAIDEQWARQVASGRRPATIRFWEWAAPAVVVGRFQSIPDEVHEAEAAREGIAVVRRCTGGGAMFIEPGNTITYSLVAPLSFVADLDVVSSYRLCDQWLIDALHELGIDAVYSGINDISSPVGKIAGAAQRRFAGVAGGPGSVLHHVTLAYDIDAAKMGRVLNTSAEKMSDKAVRSAVRRVDPLRSQTGLPREAVIDAMMRHLKAMAR
ncbi:lipoate--protein ligase family protein [Bifidobacterium jacchi]|uniref:Lipoate--protein ligase family protein n=1 Tax=Bifidobacterium jacchi TaxID=2490545 RepID=A0A5N5RJU5_9BIFI|nr:lipoate--protein ligase family protein [Bifidobacterium jacchi]